MTKNRHSRMPKYQYEQLRKGLLCFPRKILEVQEGLSYAENVEIQNPSEMLF